MISKAVSKFGKFITGRKFLTFMSKALPIMILIGFTLLFIGTPSSSAYAQEGITTDGSLTLLAMFKRLGEMMIKVCYSLMVIIFAVSSVMSGVGAQAAQMFGATGRVSMEIMRFAGGILIFIFGLMTMPLVTWIMGQIGDLVPSNLSIDVPSNFPINIQ